MPVREAGLSVNDVSVFIRSAMLCAAFCNKHNRLQPEMHPLQITITDDTAERHALWLYSSEPKMIAKRLSPLKILY